MPESRFNATLRDGQMVELAVERQWQGKMKKWYEQNRIVGTGKCLADSYSVTSANPSPLREEKGSTRLPLLVRDVGIVRTNLINTIVNHFILKHGTWF
jgi:hypothetical protein